MEISSQDYALILALEKDPLMSIKELADRVNVSWVTVKKRYTDVLERKILRHPRGLYDVEALNLQRNSVIITVPNYDAMEYIEKSCYFHPYTQYRSRFTSNQFGLFLNFNIPQTNQAREYFGEFFEAINNKGLINDYKILYSKGIRTENYGNLDNFDINTLSWNFDWENWISDIDKYPTQQPNIETQKIDLSELTELRLNIIRDINENGGLKQTDIRQKYDLSRTEAHRQYNFVVDNLIKTFRLNYNRKYFDMTDQYVIEIRDIPKKEIWKIYNKIKNDPPDFHVAMDVLENNKLIIWGTMSPMHGNKFGLEFWKRYPNTRFYTLNNRDDGAFTYYFYPNNFDLQNNKWKDSHDYMVEEPLEKLDNYFN